MKFFTVLSLFFLLSLKTSAQKKSELYLHVDSIIRYQLNFKSPHIPDTLSSHAASTSMSPIRDVATIKVTSPLIVVNKKPVNINKLSYAKMTDFKAINVLTGDTATALFGASGIYGVIIISVNKKLANKIFRK